MEKRYYAAYGSNLNLRQMRIRCPEAEIIGTSEIEDYEESALGGPEDSYVEACLEGYRSFGFDESVLRQAYADSSGNTQYKG